MSAAHTPEAGGWLIGGSLLYRLNEHGNNCDEINVTQANGSRDPVIREFTARALLKRITEPKDPESVNADLLESLRMVIHGLERGYIKSKPIAQGNENSAQLKIVSLHESLSSVVAKATSTTP